MNSNDFERDHKTKAFRVEKKQRRNDSIAWIIASIVLLFLNVVSIGRITVVGQFIDDVIFTFTFGWFKYFVYLIFIGINICIYFGIRFKFKKRFLLMVFGTWCVLAWIITAVLFIVAYHLDIKDLQIDNYFSSSIFVSSIKAYISNWKEYSIFGSYAPKSWILCDSHTYFSLWAGGGFIGAFLSAVFSYTTIYGNFGFSLFGLFLAITWIMTGDPLYLLKPKSKRVGRGLRILSLGAKEHKLKNKQKIKKEKAQKKGLFQIEYFNNENNDLSLYDSQTIADVTIEMPGFKRVSNTENSPEITEIFSVHDEMGSNPVSRNAYIDDDLMAYNSDLNYDAYLTEDENEPNYNRHHEPNNQNHVPVYNEQPRQYQQPQQPINQNQNQPQDDMGDFPTSIYGDVPVEHARKEFHRETAVTPFGANGKTTEIFKRNETEEEILAPKPEPKNAAPSDSQMTLDDFINNNTKEDITVRVPDYDSPLKKRLPKNNVTHDFEWGNMPSAEAKTPKPVVEAPKLFINHNYRLPTIDLLNDEKVDLTLQNKMKLDAENNAKIVNSVFESFNVKARVTEYQIGPSITQFIVTLDQGSKVQSVLTLENEIKLRLATQNVLMEAPINGMAAVGIEIPNKAVTPVNMKSVIGQIPLQKANSKLLFPVGKNVVGNVIFGELASMPHLLVAGSTGSGKSVMINSIITSILLRSKPHEVKMLMVDPKRVELLPYAKIPHLIAPIISDMALAAGALKKAVFEMERRYTLFSNNGVKNITGYNAQIKKAEDKLPYIVVIIDELADLMLTENKKSVEESIMRLTQMARAAGIHLIVATQRPSTDVITGVIKANIPSRISFAVANQYDSRTILDSNGAEKLVGKGDMLFMEPGNQRPIRAQGIYVSDDEISRITQFCANQQDPQFDETYTSTENGPVDAFSGKEKRLDPMYEKAIELIALSGQASTSYLQRKLQIGYNRASRIIDELEENGMIGPQNGAKSREIYIKR
jgi:S-DNA-T family DNA segregation ATPase FtsK/SpoIIIE